MKRTAKVKLTGSKIHQNKKEKISIWLFYTASHGDGLESRYDQFVPIPLNQYSKEMLRILGLKEGTKLASLNNAGLHNNSKVLDYGKEFEIELEQNGKWWNVKRVRSLEANTNSTLPQSIVESLLEDACFEESADE